ncbi:uncharacterized protein LOC116414759 [Apis florea]|uniref:uncharacterized protein LOC116414759 n=1 Tax=Apis florea TaxID=7463 RepID=UPI0012FF2A5B|nr:uncharacterized protein LOC116414759 [Apis florea]
MCLATKTVHLEATTEAFLNCLSRFLAHRGRCREICSDNGTNFMGAYNELRRIRKFLQWNGKSIGYHAIAESVEWRFMPPHAPHFGGLWETAIRSAKRHLLRTIGETRLTYEEFNTMLARVEACMNSKPLHPLSSDPRDSDSISSREISTAADDTATVLEAMARPRTSDHDSEQASRAQRRKPSATAMETRPNSPAASKIRRNDVSVHTSTVTLTRPVAKICLLSVDDSALPSHDEQPDRTNHTRN